MAADGDRAAPSAPTPIPIRLRTRWLIVVGVAALAALLRAVTDVVAARLRERETTPGEVHAGPATPAAARADASTGQIVPVPADGGGRLTRA